MTDLAHDVRVLLPRCLRHVLRSPDTIVTTAVTPIAMLLLFVYVFGAAIDAGPGRYVSYLLPGILLVTVASGVSYTAFRLFTDVSTGMFGRLRALPISRSAVLWAHVLTSLVANAVAVCVVLVVAVLMGFRSDAGVLAWGGAVGLLLLLTLALTWLAVVPGLTATSADGVGSFSLPLVFLPFVSSAFVPTDGMPAAVRWFAEHQPVTPVVDTMRALLAGRPVGGDGPLAVGWCVLLLVLAQAVALRTYRARTA